MVVEVSGCKNRAVCDDIQALEKMVTNLQCDAENERLIGVKAEKRVKELEAEWSDAEQRYLGQRDEKEKAKAKIDLALERLYDDCAGMECGRRCSECEAGKVRQTLRGDPTVRGAEPEDLEV